MRDFDLLRGVCRWSEANEQRRTSPIYGGAELEILREAEEPGVTVSEVCRRNALAPSVFYRWRAVIAEITAENLELKKKIGWRIYPVYRQRAKRR